MHKLALQHDSVCTYFFRIKAWIQPQSKRTSKTLVIFLSNAMAIILHYLQNDYLMPPCLNVLFRCAETKDNNRHGPCFFTWIRKTVTKANHLLYLWVAYARLFYHVRLHTILSIEKTLFHCQCLVDHKHCSLSGSCKNCHSRNSAGD